MVGSVDTDFPDSLLFASFWECKEYQRTVKRVETGNKLCNELSTMIQERAELEKAYSTNLKRWSSRWLSLLDAGVEYGTGSSPWKGLCKEADAISLAHQNIRDVLIDEIQANLKQWQKERFHKTSLPPQVLKESKQFEQEFEQAQKPWAKRLKKVLQHKKDYHQACKLERSLQVHVQNAKTDPAGTSEQLKKVQEKLTKAEKEVERTRTVYNNSLSDLESFNPRYLEEMTKVFNETQELERSRLAFFKEVFGHLHEALNVSHKADFDSIYRDFEQSISSVDIDADLAWWSSHHGVDMPAVFPQFEEYSPEFATISMKKRSLAPENKGVTVTAIHPVVPNPPDSNGVKPTEDANRLPANGSDAISKNPFDDETLTPYSPQGDEFGDPDDLAHDLQDDGRPGVRVRAMYEYTAQEEDELTFVEGDIFEKLRDADSQGWCLGRKDGRVGLYPDNYVSVVD